MPALADSDPQKWEYDLHTKVKHEILQYYLAPWTTVVGRSASAIAYIDAFAGRGRYLGGQAGSPLLAIDTALDAMNKRAGSLRRIICHFVEPDPANYSNLVQELAHHAPAQDPRVEYHLHSSSFATASPRIITDIRQHTAASFFFVDPFGYDEPSMVLLGRILTLPRSEVFVNFMYNFINRAAGVQGNHALAATLDSLFGTSTWRASKAIGREEREKDLIETYRQQLKQHGARYALPFRMGDDVRDRTLYYLIHASKHKDAVRIMKDAMVAASSPGQLGFAGLERHAITPLFNFDIDRLSPFLESRYAGQMASFDQIVAETIEETGACKESDYRTAIRQLEHNRRVSVRRISSKRSGIGGDDQITFLESSA